MAKLEPPEQKAARKIFLVINTICMGIGMFIVYLAGQLGSAAVSITVGNDSLGITCLLCVALPLIISIALFLSKVAETKGIDLNTVRADEWD